MGGDVVARRHLHHLVLVRGVHRACGGETPEEARVVVDVDGLGAVELVGHAAHLPTVHGSHELHSETNPENGAVLVALDLQQRHHVLVEVVDVGAPREQQGATREDHAANGMGPLEGDMGLLARARNVYRDA